jgi:hypothetical protein
MVPRCLGSIRSLPNYQLHLTAGVGLAAAFGLPLARRR